MALSAISRIHRILAAAGVAAVLCLPAMAQTAGAGKARKEPSDANPIKIGAISTLSGPAVFPQTPLAAKSVFDAVNAAGGIQGRKLVLLQEDDKANPQLAREAALRLVNDAKVVANVGGASVLECSVNGGIYAEAGLVSIPGLGLDLGCYGSPMIAPVNVGPFGQLQVALRYAAERLWAERLCVLRVGSPASMQKGYDAALQAWAAQGGRPLHLDIRDIRMEDNMAEPLRKAVDGKCQAIVFGGPAPFVIATAKAARQMDIRNVALLYAGGAYTSQVAVALGADGEGIYAMSEFEPWSSRSASLTDWRTLMEKANISLTSSSQGGYVAARIFVRVLQSIQGDINRASVTAAFKTMKPVDAPLLGMPFVFGPGDSHHPNEAVVPVRLQEGRWRIAYHDWIKVSK